MNESKQANLSLQQGKVKSIYDNMSKNLLDPTLKFDSHLSKNASIVTSLTSYRAYELTQVLVLTTLHVEDRSLIWIIIDYYTGNICKY